MEEYKASSTFVKKKAQAVGAFKASQEYHDSHIVFSRKIYHGAHKEGRIDCRKLIEEEHPDTDLAFLDYKEEEDEETLTLEVSTPKKDNTIELVLSITPSSSNADVSPSEPLSDVVDPQEKIGD